MGRVLKVESVSQIHEFFGYEKPKHLLITLIDNTKVNPAVFSEDIQIITGFYSITMKEGVECELKYGRQFLTRSHVNKDVIIRFEAFLKNYFDSDKPETEGLLMH